MMREDRVKNQRRTRGALTAELAIAAPLLMLMKAGAADFARIFYHRGMHFTPGYPISCGRLIRLPRTCWTISE